MKNGAMKIENSDVSHYRHTPAVVIAYSEVATGAANAVMVSSGAGEPHVLVKQEGSSANCSDFRALAVKGGPPPDDNPGFVFLS